MTLEQEFQTATIEDVYLAAYLRCAYKAIVFLKIVRRDGGVLAAKQLLARAASQSGFIALSKCGALDITVEHLMLQKKWRQLFSQEELHKAASRLRAHVNPHPGSSNSYANHKCTAPDCSL